MIKITSKNYKIQKINKIKNKEKMKRIIQI